MTIFFGGIVITLNLISLPCSEILVELKIIIKDTALLFELLFPILPVNSPISFPFSFTIVNVSLKHNFDIFSLSETKYHSYVSCFIY